MFSAHVENTCTACAPRACFSHLGRMAAHWVHWVAAQVMEGQMRKTAV